MITHVIFYKIIRIGIAEFDNENIAEKAYKEFSGKGTDEGNNLFEWILSKPFVINEKPQEIEIRFAEKNVIFY
jgi:hypothetical protein